MKAREDTNGRVALDCLDQVGKDRDYHTIKKIKIFFMNDMNE